MALAMMGSWVEGLWRPKKAPMSTLGRSMSTERASPLNMSGAMVTKPCLAKLSASLRGEGLLGSVGTWERGWTEAGLQLVLFQLDAEDIG